MCKGQNKILYNKNKRTSKIIMSSENIKYTKYKISQKKKIKRERAKETLQNIGIKKH